VKGHDGVEGNEQADERAKREVWIGERMHWSDIVTPAAIRQAYTLHARAPAHLSWPRQALRRLTYLETDKGPQRQWMREIGKTVDASCVCDASMAGHRRMRLIYICAHGWEMEWEDRRNRRGRMRSGVQRWRDS